MEEPDHPPVTAPHRRSVGAGVLLTAPWRRAPLRLFGALGLFAGVFVAVFPPRMVLFSVVVPELWRMPPPRLVAAFSVTVVLRRLTVSEYWEAIPPPSAAVFPLIVQFVVVIAVANR